MWPVVDGVLRSLRAGWNPATMRADDLIKERTRLDGLKPEGCVCLLAACGHSSPGPAPGTSPHISSPSANPATTAPVVTVGCGTYCQQAGISAGNGPRGYPCAAAGCLRCPPQNCVALESSGATATNGVAIVKLRCNLSAACHGAILICMRGDFCDSGPTWGPFAGGGRLGRGRFRDPRGNHGQRGGCPHRSRQAARN